VDEHTITLDHVPVFFRSVDGDAVGPEDPGSGATAGRSGSGAVPDRPGSDVLYLHGAPTSSDDWLPFLERTGGIAPDLIGFGRSGKGGHLDYSPLALADFVRRFLDELGVGRVSVVGHDWGAAVGLLLANREPGRIERLVLIDAVPLLGGYRWHTAARAWRRPVIGELVMGSTSRRLLTRQLRKGTVRPDALTESRLTSVWEQFDQGTQRALLRLHRAADETRLEELGAELGSIDAPALVLWGEQDPWFKPEFADAYGSRLPNATVERIPGAGHWPWLDQPFVIDLVADFLAKR
jgi:pimeloyl-ACP methyl ester carboxylesterase